MSAPAVSVLVTARNAAPYVKEALTSILSGSWEDLELIIVDDASDDGTPEIVAGLGDPRMRLVSLTQPVGAAHALNHGLSLCRAKLIARMDADDIAVPRRLERQLTYLNGHPEVIALGSWARLFGSVSGTWKLPTAPREVEAAMLFTCPMCQPSVVVRAQALLDIGGYPLTHPHAEDYAMCAALLGRGDLVNLPEVLLHYRRHPNSTSAARAGQQQADSARVQRDLLARMGLSVAPATMRLHTLVGSAAALDDALHRQVLSWTRTLLLANARTRLFDQEALEQVIGHLVARLSLSPARA